jgi:hypothetical protein
MPVISINSTRSDDWERMLSVTRHMRKNAQVASVVIDVGLMVVIDLLGRNAL